MKNFKKYLLSILFSILFINFIVSTSSFFSSLSPYLISSKMVSDPTNESLISIAKELETTLDDTTYELTEAHGEEYPALGIVYYKTVSHYSSVNNIQNFIFSLICGFAVGNIIYFIWVAKFKSYKLVLLLILSLFVTSCFLALSDILTFVANSEEIKFGLSEIFWNMEVWCIPYIITCLVLYGAHKAYTVYVEIQNS